MNITALALILFLSASSYAATSVLLKPGQIFTGSEELNFIPTGKKCQIEVIDLIDFSLKGNACKVARIKFLFNEVDVSEELHIANLKSRVTNQKTREYPGRLSCAEPIRLSDGNKANVSIYSKDHSLLHNPMFTYEHKVGDLEVHYFLSLSSFNKKPSRAAMNIIEWTSENFRECVGLRAKY